jgi:hypothetical protein
MPTPAVALKLKKFRRRFGITAPSVVVRSYMPWPWYVLLGVAAVFLVATIAWTFMQRSEVDSISSELDTLRLKVRELDDERLVLRSTAGTEQNIVLMERATQQQLMLRVNALESENAALKEDMLLFERLIPVPGDEALVRIESLRLIKDGDGRFRYRLLVAFQPAKQSLDFRGRLQILVVFKEGEREHQLLIPDKKDSAADFSIETKHFWRKEGVFELPLGGQLLRVEALLLQGDTLKAKRAAQL